VAGGGQRPERGDRGLEAGQLTAEPADLAGVGADLGPSPGRLGGVVLRGDLGELRVEIGHGTAGGSSVVAAATGSVAGAGVSPDGRLRGARSKTVEAPGIGL